MVVNTLLKVLEQLLHKIKANRRREMPSSREEVARSGRVVVSNGIMVRHMCVALSCQVFDEIGEGGLYLGGWGFGGWGAWRGRHEAQAPSNQVKNYKQT